MQQSVGCPAEGLGLTAQAYAAQAAKLACFEIDFGRRLCGAPASPHPPFVAFPARRFAPILVRTTAGAMR